MRQRLARRAESSGRIDDNTDSIIRRLRTFADENLKVEEHLQQTGRFWKVSAMWRKNLLVANSTDRSTLTQMSTQYIRL